MLAPSRELSRQITECVKSLSNDCARVIQCLDVSDPVKLSVQKPLLIDLPDIVVGTPSRILAHLKAQNMVLKESLEMLVIDEADLIFSFGYEKDLRALLAFLPEFYRNQNSLVYPPIILNRAF